MIVDKFISYQISNQFPSIYREEGDALVDLVKAYYQFLERGVEGYYVTGYVLANDAEQTKSYFARMYSTLSEATTYKNSIIDLDGYRDVKIVQTKNQSVYHSRRLFEYRDIDNTLEQMLLFFKNKFLRDLPFSDVDDRFAVKHILDLYRRKGTIEGIELFFRLFYSQDVELYYPSRDILKPSASKWEVGRYIELFPQNPENLRNLSGAHIYGSVSGATATIDRVAFYQTDNTLFPVVYLSNVRGQFVGYDQLLFDDAVIGIVRGSLTGVTTTTEGSSNNNVGDIVSITSDTGSGGKGRVTSVSAQSTGEIKFSVVDGGFGYTVSNTNILVSDQVLILDTSEPRFIVQEVVSQANTGATGVVIGQQSVTPNTLAVGIMVTSSNSFVSGANVYSIDRVTNITESVSFAGPRNSTASANIGSITNTQNISVIPDVIGNFLNVPLNANNYSAVPPALIQMSGTSSANLTTSIANAFQEKNITIGSISSLIDIDPGIGYVNDVFVLPRDNELSRYNLVNQVIVHDPQTTVYLGVGSTIVQNNPSGNTTNLSTRGIVKSRQEGIVEVVQLSFQGFTSSNNIFLEGSNIPIRVLDVYRDYETLPLGLNARISGTVSSTMGKIMSVDVFDSGVGFLHQKPVVMKNMTKIAESQAILDALNSSPSATPEQKNAAAAVLAYHQDLVAVKGISFARGQGMSEGTWKSKTSHLNTSKKIQDSSYYQDFSYDISSSMDPTTYEQPFKDIVHVAGTRLFHSFRLRDDINTEISISSIIDVEV